MLERIEEPQKTSLDRAIELEEKYKEEEQKRGYPDPRFPNDLNRVVLAYQQAHRDAYQQKDKNKLAETLYRYASFLLKHTSKLSFYQVENKKPTEVAIRMMEEAAKLEYPAAIRDVVHRWLFVANSAFVKEQEDNILYFLTLYSSDRESLVDLTIKIAKFEKLQITEHPKFDEALYFLTSTRIKNPENRARADFLLVCFYSSPKWLEIHYLDAALANLKAIVSPSKLKEILMRFIALKYLGIAVSSGVEDEDFKKCSELARQLDPNSIHILDNIIKLYKKKWDVTHLIPFFQEKFALLQSNLMTNTSISFMVDFMMDLKEFHRDLVKKQEGSSKQSDELENCILEFMHHFKENLSSFYADHNISNPDNTVEILTKWVQTLAFIKGINLTEDINHSIDILLRKINNHILSLQIRERKAAYLTPTKENSKDIYDAYQTSLKHYEDTLKEPSLNSSLDEQTKAYYLQMLHSFINFLPAYSQEERYKNEAMAARIKAAELGNAEAISDLVYAWFFQGGSYDVKTYSPTLHDLLYQARRLASTEKNKDCLKQYDTIEQVLSFLENSKKLIKNPVNYAFACYIHLCYHVHTQPNGKKASSCLQASLDAIHQLAEPKKTKSNDGNVKLKFKNAIALICLEMGLGHLRASVGYEKDKNKAESFFKAALKYDPDSLYINDALIDIYEEKQDVYGQGNNCINFSSLIPCYQKKFELLKDQEQIAAFIIHLQSFYKKLVDNKEEKPEKLAELKACIQIFIQRFQKILIDAYDEKRTAILNEEDFDKIFKCIKMLREKNIDENLNHTLDFISDEFMCWQWIDLAVKQEQVQDRMRLLHLASEKGSLKVNYEVAKICTMTEPYYGLAIQCYEKILQHPDPKSDLWQQAKNELFGLIYSKKLDSTLNEKQAVKIFCAHAMFDEKRIQRLIELNYIPALLAQSQRLMLSNNSFLFSFTTAEKIFNYTFKALEFGDQDEKRIALELIFTFAKNCSRFKKEVETQLLKWFENHTQLLDELLNSVKNNESGALGTSLIGRHAELFNQLAQKNASFKRYLEIYQKATKTIEEHWVIMEQKQGDDNCYDSKSQTLFPFLHQLSTPMGEVQVNPDYDFSAPPKEEIIETTEIQSIYPDLSDFNLNGGADTNTSSDKKPENEKEKENDNTSYPTYRN